MYRDAMIACDVCIRSTFLCCSRASPIRVNIKKVELNRRSLVQRVTYSICDNRIRKVNSWTPFRSLNSPFATK